MIHDTERGTKVARMEDLPTPALVVDGEVARRNVNRLADYAKRHGLDVRPHTKTHKSRVLAKLQLEAGAIGLTVAKVGEAEEMAGASDDVLMAYPAIDPSRCGRLARLAQTKTIRVAVDSDVAVESLSRAAGAASSTIGLLVDVDVGMGRTGLSSAAAALALAQKISKTPHTRLEGILCYPGHIWATAEQQAGPLAAVAARLEEVIELWEKHGLAAPIVSGGSTPTALRSHLVRHYTEIRSGTYIFNDMNTLRGGYCSLEDCAARIVCTVVSNVVDNQVILDGGTKTFTSDLCIPDKQSGHGLIVEYPEAKIAILSEEHAQVDVSRCERKPKIGERVTVVPNHICPCVNLRDAFWLAEPDGSLRQIVVDARGRLS